MAAGTGRSDALGRGCWEMFIYAQGVLRTAEAAVDFANGNKLLIRWTAGNIGPVEEGGKWTNQLDMTRRKCQAG